MATTQTKPGAKILDVKDAARAAAAYAEQLFPDSARSVISLEEVELSEDEKYWLITLGFNVEQKDTTEVPWTILPPKAKYRIFKVDARTGRVVSMKIRAIE
jgi:hypothetical protein